MTQTYKYTREETVTGRCVHLDEMRRVFHGRLKDSLDGSGVNLLEFIANDGRPTRLVLSDEAMDALHVLTAREALEALPLEDRPVQNWRISEAAAHLWEVFFDATTGGWEARKSAEKE